MVRLKARCSFVRVVRSLFQFHDGSIKGNCCGIRLPAAEKFQFHDGSIKGVPSNKKKAVIYGFNSTMVRLKVVRRPQKNNSLSMTYFL